MTDRITGHPASAAPAFLAHLMNSAVRFAPEPEGAPATPPATPPAAPETPPAAPAAATPPAAPATPPATPPAAATPPATPPAAPATSPAAPPAAPATALTPEPPKEPEIKWPEDWRIRMATVGGKTDDVLAKMLERYADPGALAIKLREQDKLISSGKLKSAAPPDNAKPEELANWRKENGIPLEAKGYLESLPDGVIVGEAEKPLLAGFAERMHAKNAPPAVVQDAITWYFQNQEAQKTAQLEADTTAKNQTQDELRKEWGDNYRREVSAVTGLLDQAPAGVKELVLGARLADGTPLGSHVGALKWLNGLAREINPAATVVPGAGAGAMSAIADEKKALEAKMSDKQSDYWKGPAAEANQARYRELVDAELRMNARGKAA